MIPLRDINPNERPPIVTLLLIAANLAAFLFELSLPAEGVAAFFHAYGLVPARYIDPMQPAWADVPGGYLPFVSSMFLHGGWMHLIGNMWSLWLFGDNVEDRLGRRRYLVFYLGCGLAAGFAHLAVNPRSPIPTIGASGAIAGVMGAYLVLFPRAQIQTLVPMGLFTRIMPLPAWIFLGIWIVFQFFNGVIALRGSGGEAGGIAFWAHIGGFVAGMALRSVFAPPPVRRLR